MARDAIVLVHGLWTSGFEFGVMGRRLRRDHELDVQVFKYSSMRSDFRDTSLRLGRFIDEIEAPRVHLIAHSLGGAFVHRMLVESTPARLGRVVLLASPLAGCRAAEGVQRKPMLRPLIGPHAARELAGRQSRQWPGSVPAGAIAGNRPLGTGQFFAHFQEENDGTVAVSETRIPGLTDHIVLPHSHMGMLLAPDVAAQSAHFLRHAVFER